MDEKVLRLVFSFFVGALLALFVGFGIHTFYPPPQEPAVLGEVRMLKNPTDAQVAAATEAQRVYDQSSQRYSRDVSMMSMAGAVVLLGTALALARSNQVMANGALLGGLFTLVYGVARGFASQDTRVLFVELTLALAIVVALGLRRFRTRAPVGPAESHAENHDAGGPGGGVAPAAR